MPLFKKLVGVVLGLVIILFGAGLILPSAVHVERQITVDAPAEAVFAAISDFSIWDAWSPWAKLDPDAAFAVTGSGVGQRMEWASDDPRVGSGSQEIIELDSPSLLKTQLEFGEQGVANATFALKSEGERTEVVWALDSDMREGVPLIMQPVNTYLGFFMDAMVGPDYEQGLENLKDVVES